MPYYAVANGRIPGVFTNWNDCKKQIKGFSNAVYKKFETKKLAESFITTNISKMQEVVDYTLYTDGACSKNGSKDARAGYGIFFGVNDSRNVSKRISGKQTNNTAELTAIIKTYKIIKSDLKMGKKIAIVSDSIYAIRCATTYGKKCHSQKWIDDIPNKELVKRAYKIYKRYPNVQFIHCRAHTKNTDAHTIGNDWADKLATQSIWVKK